MHYSMNDLAEHLLKHKDAVLLYGSRAIKNKNIDKIPIEEKQEKMSRKNQRKNPEMFLNYFLENVYEDPDNILYEDKYNDLKYLCNTGAIKTVVDLNSDGILKIKNPEMDIINLHGSMQEFFCDNKKCAKKFTYSDIIENGQYKITKCPECGQYIRPSMLLNGENYNDDKFNAIRFLINETHTLITFDINYSEDPIVNMIIDFDGVKTIRPKDELLLIGIYSTDLGFDINSIAFHDFVSSKSDPFNSLTIIKNAVQTVNKEGE